MMRPALLSIACLTLSACIDFDGLIAQCLDGGSPCDTRGTDAGGMPDGGAPSTEDCAAQTAATLQSPDGSTAFCFNGFVWENPLPHGVDLTSVWGPAADDVWAAGAASMLMHWDGTRWASLQGQVQAQRPSDRLGLITSLVGSVQGAWLAGQGLSPHILDGGSWIPSGRAAPGGALWDIAAMGVSPDGRMGPVAIATNGAVFSVPDWARMVGPPATNPPDVVRGVAVTNEGACAFSGAYVSGATSYVAVRACDGGLIATFDAGFPGPIWAENEALVTSMANQEGTFAFWVRASSVEPRGPALSDVSCLGATFLPSRDAGFIVGPETTIVDTWGVPQADKRFGHTLNAVWAFVDGGAWAVGERGALVREARDGWEWKQQGFEEGLFGLWVQDDGGVFLSGRDGFLMNRVTGSRINAGAGTIRDVYRIGPDDWFVVSENGNMYRNQDIVYAAPASNEGLASISFADDDAWVVGYDTVLHRQADGGWVKDGPTVPASPQEWWKIARAGSTFMVVGGQGAVAVHSPDGGWTTRQEPGGNTFYGIWTIDSEQHTAWIVGGGPSIWHFDADDGRFTRTALPTTLTGSLFDVWGSGPNDVWAVGEGGLAVHFDGASWRVVETGTRSSLERVRSRPLPDGRRELIVVGDFGTVLRKRY